MKMSTIKRKEVTGFSPLTNKNHYCTLHVCKMLWEQPTPYQVENAEAEGAMVVIWQPAWSRKTELDRKMQRSLWKCRKTILDEDSAGIIALGLKNLLTGVKEVLHGSKQGATKPAHRPAGVIHPEPFEERLLSRRKWQLRSFQIQLRKVVINEA